MTPYKETETRPRRVLTALQPQARLHPRCHRSSLRARVAIVICIRVLALRLLRLGSLPQSLVRDLLVMRNLSRVTKSTPELL